MELLTLGQFADALNQNPRSGVLPTEPFKVKLVAQDGTAKLTLHDRVPLDETAKPKDFLIISDRARQIEYVDGSWGSNLYKLKTEVGDPVGELVVTNTGNY